MDKEWCGGDISALLGASVQSKNKKLLPFRAATSMSHRPFPPHITFSWLPKRPASKDVLRDRGTKAEEGCKRV